MRFCFYSGYRNLKGGYTTLLLTLIRELYRQKQEVVLINFTEGLIADELMKDKVAIKILGLDTMSWKEISAAILPTDVFIITKFEEVYRHLFKVNPRVVYFDINDFICRISEYKFGLKFPFLGKKLVQKLLAANSLFFMDDTGVFNLKQNFSIVVKHPVYLPIPVTVAGENTYLKRHRYTDGILRLTYIGRSVNWKMMPLKKILADCARSAIQYRIHFSIVVDNRQDFMKYINLNEYKYAANLSINVQENMLPSSINEFLLHNADGHFAMGTAALDAAKLGIPTVLVDYGTHDFPNGYQYKWLYETKNYSLGKNLDKLPADTGFSIEELLSVLSGDNKKLESYSELSYQYVLENHSVEKIVFKMMAVCHAATFRLNCAKKFVLYYSNAHNFIKSMTRVFVKR